LQYRKGGGEYGFPKGLVGFFKAAEEILALTPDRNHLDIWRPHDICQWISDRAVHLHFVLTACYRIKPGV
jgi:hypothetical protein